MLWNNNNNKGDHISLVSVMNLTRDIFKFYCFKAMVKKWHSHGRSSRTSCAGPYMYHT